MRAFAVSVAAAAALGLAAAVAGAAAEPGGSVLAFERDGVVVARLAREALARACGARTIAVDDPAYGRRKRFRACPLATVLRLGFGDLDAAVRADVDVVFRARDGYVKSASLALVREPGGWLAFADADRMRGDDPGWEPIDSRHGVKKQIAADRADAERLSTVPDRARLVAEIKQRIGGMELTLKDWEELLQALKAGIK